MTTNRRCKAAPPSCRSSNGCSRPSPTSAATECAVTDEPIIDQDARDRIETRGLNETLFVEAGAGTGKTHELVERVTHLVLTEDVPLRNIAAITFTDAAARRAA